MNAKSGKKPEVKPVVTTAQTKEAEVKPAETKEAEVKAAETKTLEAKKKATRKAAAKKQSESETEVFVEYYGQQSSVEEITNKVKEVFVSEGHRVSTIKSLKLYLKPEDGFAYYVINEKFAGRVPLF